MKDTEGVFRGEVFVRPTLNQDHGSLELVSGVTMNGIEEALHTKIVDLEDEAVVDALLEMGWTPPPVITHQVETKKPQLRGFLLRGDQVIASSQLVKSTQATSSVAPVTLVLIPDLSCSLVVIVLLVSTDLTSVSPS